MLKIYGADMSSPSNKVRYVANYLGLPFEYIFVNIREGYNRSPEFLQINPFGKIPAIDDGGFTLFESDAIVQYLAEKAGSPICPSDVRARAVVNQWTSFVSIHIGGAMSKVLFNRVFAPILKMTVDERSIQDGLSFLDKFLPVIDERLGRHPYLCGEALTLADFDLLANLDPAEVSGVELSKHQNLLKWRVGLRGQEFYTKCHKVYGEKLKNFQAKP